MKLLVGLLKGAVIGGAVGYGAFALQHSTGFFNGFLAFGVVGLLVGVLVGRPLWSLITDKSATSWAGILKGIFGFGVGCGLYAIIAKAWTPTFQIAGEPAMWPPFLGGAIGAIYGAFVEVDDATGEDARALAAQKSAPVKQLKK